MPAAASRLLYHHDMRWIGDVPPAPRADLRPVVILKRPGAGARPGAVRAPREPGRLAVILPEDRMKRRDGFDRHGERMAVRGGIADLIREIRDGRMLLAYSGGLHHVQAPGDRWPSLFEVVRMRLESLEIADYRSRLMSEAGEEGFRGAVMRDVPRRHPFLGTDPATGADAVHTTPRRQVRSR